MEVAHLKGRQSIGIERTGSHVQRILRSFGCCGTPQTSGGTFEPWGSEGGAGALTERAGELGSAAREESSIGASDEGFDLYGRPGSQNPYDPSLSKLEPVREQAPALFDDAQT